jgi:hypothetical protein
VVEDIDAVVDTSESLRAWAGSEYWNIRQAVDTLISIGWKSAIHDEAVRVVFWIDEKVIFVEAGDVGGRYLFLLVDQLKGIFRLCLREDHPCGLDSSHDDLDWHRSPERGCNGDPSWMGS